MKTTTMKLKKQVTRKIDPMKNGGRPFWVYDGMSFATKAEALDAKFTAEAPAHVPTAVHTVLAELPADTHEDDVLDAVFGIVGAQAFDTYGEARGGSAASAAGVRCGGDRHGRGAGVGDRDVVRRAARWSG